MPILKYRHLINSLEKALFPDPLPRGGQEVDLFTRQGKERLDKWFEGFFSQLRKERQQSKVSKPADSNSDCGNYYDNFVDGNGY